MHSLSGRSSYESVASLAIATDQHQSTCVLLIQSTLVHPMEGSMKSILAASALAL